MPDTPAAPALTERAGPSNIAGLIAAASDVESESDADAEAGLVILHISGTTGKVKRGLEARLDIITLTGAKS